MTKQRKPTGYVIYEGPSLLNGAPIVAIAVVGSSNRKTGNMVQTYILSADERPTAALKSGADAAVCGDCKHRPANGGACYVVVAQGPTVVYKAWQRGLYPSVAWALFSGDLEAHLAANMQALTAAVRGRMVRLGTYGDPMAVPAHVWQSLLVGAEGHTGYTHQWGNPAIPAAQREAINRLCMASADDPQEASLARAQGLRYFRIRTSDEPMAPREFVCPASEEAGKRKTCAECGACNGSAKASAASPVIVAHGSKARRFIAIRAAA